MKAIIIGASGYLGSQLYNHVNRSMDAYGTMQSVSGPENRFLPFSLDNPSRFDYDIIQNSSAVFLTAAISAPDICSGERNRAWAVNVTGTTHFISKVIERGGRIIFFSSDTVYGERDEEFDESAPCTPAGDYAEMKHEVEKRFIGDPCFKTIRLSYVFSRDDKFTSYLTTCVANGDEAEIFHPFYRSVIYRADVVKAAVALAQRWDEFPQPVINFGGPEVLARTQYAQVLKEVTWPSLQFKITEPDQGFFKIRPRAIHMRSPVLKALLGRKAHSLREAASIEFSAKGDA